MARMRAIEAAVLVMRREGVDTAFGVPGAAINPMYAALKKIGGIDHVLARHVEGASHMAEGYTRTKAGNIGVCIGTSGPAGTDMITGLYSASADSIPILCITGQAPRARLHKEDFQAVDISSIAAPVAKWATTVLEPAQVPYVFQKAFQLMRSDRPGPVLIDLPFDVQMAEIEFDIDAYEPLPVSKPKATRVQAEKVLAMLDEAERPLLVAGGGIFNADAAERFREFAELTGIPVIPTLMGWGVIPMPDLGIVSDAGAALDAFLEVAREWKAAGKLKSRAAWLESCQQRKRTLQRKTHFDNVPVKPQRVYEEMNEFFGKDACYVSTIGLSQIAGAQFLHVYQPRHWINCGQAGPLGWTIPAALGVVKADPSRQVVALSGDYDFQFMIEELAVGAQFKLPYIHVLVNNSYLGLIRQAQRGFDMDYCVQLAFDNINAPELEGYGVDHVAVVEGLGCKAIRVFDPNEIGAALAKARELMQQHQVPVVVEVILERVTNISMGTEINAINEFEELAEKGADAPTAISLLD
ncbi:glyoxylate carboligase [Pseudomonas aeruginosa]|uniref:thiamine pyrophosphate-dependent enzyme n=1 Tax=Pseudomonas aeruginosa TaxID=287 RepID=UPI001044104F|nr:glyoxylate carboligase [Pseudomonas aeruginosa]